RWFARLLARVPRSRAIAAIASRHRAAGTVRLVIVVAVTIATAAAILGASVEARPDVAHLVDDELARLPVLPSDVALLRLEPKGLAAFAPERRWPSFDRHELTALRGAVTRAVPGGELIALRDLGMKIASDSIPCDCVAAPL